ncbi:MAG: TRAP transporter small permease [Proteobacteria bacterium]|nr:TRAP transporter small permease [Pseudomonadota bacterium]
MTDPANLYPTNKVLATLDAVEEKLLCLLLAVMIILACLQIFLRTVFSGGLLWIDPFLRYLVIWCGLLGAVTATSQGRHIALDIFAGRIPPAIDPWLSLLTQLFSTFAAAGLTWAGWLFLAGEIEAGGDGPLSLPLWFWNGIFPLSFGLITCKSFLLFIMQIKALVYKNQPLSDKQR